MTKLLLKTLIKLIVFVVLLNSFQQVMADEDESSLNITGHIKNRFGISKTKSIYTDRVNEQLNFNNLARFKLMKHFDDIASFEGAYEIGIRYSKRVPRSSSGKVYRIFEIDPTLVDHELDSNGVGRIDVHNNLDRFTFSYFWPNYDLSVGRQPISFGSGRTINPTDVVAPFTVNTIDSEERFGVDAIKLKSSIGEMGGVEVSFIGGKNAKLAESAFYLKLNYPVFDWDSSILVMNFRENYLLGVDLQGSIKGFGVWLEGAAYNMKNESGFFRGITGAEYKVDDFSLYLEYYHNGAGVRKKEEYFNNILKAAYSLAGVKLFSRNYVIPGLGYQVHPLVTMSSSLIMNVEDKSSFISLGLEYNIFPDCYLDLGGFLGSSGGRSSEFSYYADTAYMSLRSYF